MNNNDAIKGSELYLKKHGFDLGKLSQCSSADEIDAIISSTVSKKDAPLFKAIINKSFVPNDDGSFRPFYETNPRTAGDSAEWFDFFRSYGNGTELKKEVHFDLSNYKGRKMNFLGYDEEITNDFRASDLVQQGVDSNIHIENKVGVWGNNLRPRIRQELYADALRLDNDPTSKQEYRIYVNAANGKCLFDDSEQASYLKTMLERYPDRCTVKFNDIKLSPNDIETIISKKERGVLAKDICKKVLDTQAKEVSGFQKSSLGRASSHTGKLFNVIGAAGAASGSSINWGKIITSIIAVLVVLALIVGVVVLLAKILPPVFEAIGQFFVNLWNGICKIFGAIGRFFANIGRGIWNFIKGIGNFFKGLFSSEPTNDTLDDTTNDSSSEFIPYEEIRTYSITYNLDGGVNSENNPETYDIKVGITQDNDGNIREEYYKKKSSLYGFHFNEPTKEGFVFVGWFTDLENESYEIKYVENITLYAAWTKLYTITLISGSASAKIEYTHDEYSYKITKISGSTSPGLKYKYSVGRYDTLELPILKSGDGYIFSGWFSSSNYDCAPTLYVNTPNDYIFYAGFENGPTPDITEINGTEVYIRRYVNVKEKIIKIPKYYEGKTVVGLGEELFAYSSPTELYLPSSIEFIESWSFIRADSIEKIYITSNNINLELYSFSGADRLKTIVFSGTKKINFDGSKAEWTKETTNFGYSCYFTSNCTIVCSDGELIIPANY